MQLLTSAAELDAYIRPRPGGCALVPTMGALHDGHASLIRSAVAAARAASLRAGCVVTVFVNPTQFTEPKDFERYPKTLDADAAICARSGAHALFAPPLTDVYPPAAPVPTPPLPKVATDPGLEDHFRPGHFAGVCQVVNRLFDLIPTRIACFGEKDWQQLQVIRAMVQALHRPIDIRPIPTVREPDGLAMSSRNRFLTPPERASALALWAALRAAGHQHDPAAAEAAMRSELTRAGLVLEYAVVRDAETLLAPQTDRPRRALIAARSPNVRLIDNAPHDPA